MRKMLSPTVYVIGIALAWGAYFVSSTVAIERLPHSLVLGVSAALAGLLVVGAEGGFTDLRRRVDDLDWHDGAAGALCLLVAPWLAQSWRLSDAPYGSVVLFLMTAGWALIAVTVWMFRERLSSAAGRLALAFGGAAAAAGILSNWERPSSFSPFVKFPEVEAAILLGGVAWALGSLLLADRMRVDDARESRAAAGLTAALLGTIAAAAGILRVGIGPVLVEWRVLATVGVSLGAAFLLWARLSEKTSPGRAAAGLMLPPVLLSFLTVVEQSIGNYGPRPMLVVPVLVSSAAVLLTAGGVAYMSEEAPAPAGTWVRRAAFVLAAVAVAAALLGLVLPDLAAEVNRIGVLEGDYNVSWRMLGAETAGGWFAVAAGASALYSAWRARSTRMLVFWAAVIAAFALAYWVLGETPLRTWTRWIPPDVQQDYGTEYASLVFTPLRGYASIVSLGLSAGSMAMLLVGGDRRDPPAAQVTDGEVLE